jgi:hypothetical protein
MAATLNLIITDAGIQEVINAQHDGTAPVRLSQVGFGRGIYTPVPSQTALHDEIKRVGTISGGVVGGNIMHIQAIDGDASAAYAVYEIGVYTASGTLFAVYSQPLPIIHKVADSEIMVAIDIILTGVEPTAVTVGDTNYTLAPATTSNLGVVELATDGEAIAGTDTERALTPAAGAAAMAAHDTALREMFVTTHAAESPTTGDAQTIYGVKTIMNRLEFKGTRHNPGIMPYAQNGMYFYTPNCGVIIDDSAHDITIQSDCTVRITSGDGGMAIIGEEVDVGGGAPFKGILGSLYLNDVGGLFYLRVSLQNGVDGDGFSRGDTIFTSLLVGQGDLRIVEPSLSPSGTVPAAIKFRALQGVTFYQGTTGYTVSVLALRVE